MLPFGSIPEEDPLTQGKAIHRDGHLQQGPWQSLLVMPLWDSRVIFLFWVPPAALPCLLLQTVVCGRLWPGC